MEKFESLGYDRSATNGVRVTSCSFDFDTAMATGFKLRSIGLYNIPYNSSGIKLLSLIFINFENLKIQNFFFYNVSFKIILFFKKMEYMLNGNG